MRKTILITGAVRGIGHDAAFALAKRGHRVIATTRTEEQANKLRLEVAEANLPLEVEKLDITSQEDVDHAAAHEIDVLINNAATNESGPLAEIPLDRVQRLLEVNVLGTLRLTQAVSKKMLAKKQGTVVIVSSTAGRMVIPYLGPYHMSKFAVEAMGDALRLELEPRGIQVSLIEPGLILTGFNEQMAATKYDWLNEQSAFADDLDLMKKHDAELPARSYSTKSVVWAIIDTVEADRPKPRYVRPRIYEPMIVLAKLLPTKLRDRLLRRTSGLSR